jgi:outer membrane protein OmpA-like peptidoglycan-associated protein
MNKLLISVSISAVVCVTLTACALSPRVRSNGVDTSLPKKSSAALYRDIGQIFQSLSPMFALCRGDGCPTPTPKTLAVDNGVAAAPLPSPSLPIASADTSVSAHVSSLVPVSLAAPVPSVAPTETIVARVVLSFPTSSSYLTPSMQKRLDDSLPAAGSATKVVIRGRTDDVGPAQLNDRLAYLRALAVRNHLVSRKAATDDKLEIDSKGNCCYLIANTDDKCRAQNRRVEVEFVAQS